MDLEEARGRPRGLTVGWALGARQPGWRSGKGCCGVDGWRWRDVDAGGGLDWMCRQLRAMLAGGGFPRGGATRRKKRWKGLKMNLSSSF